MSLVFAESFHARESRSIRVTFELVSVEISDLSRLLRQFGGDADATRMRHAVGELVGNNRAKLEDRIVLQGIEGHPAGFRSNEEVIYPTESGGAEPPNDLTLVNTGQDALRNSPGSQHGFETRDAGQNFFFTGFAIEEKETPLVKLDTSTAEIVTLLRKDRLTHPDFPLDTMVGQWVPAFYTTRASGVLAIPDGGTALCATFRPRNDRSRRLMLFVKTRIRKTLIGEN